MKEFLMRIRRWIDEQKEHSAVTLAHGESPLLYRHTHWWIFIFPLIILLLGFYLWIKARSRGYFTLEFLLYLPAERPSFIPQEVYKYLLIAMDEFRNLLPDTISNFIINTRFTPLKWLSQLVMLYGLYRLIRSFIIFVTTKITLTNERLMIITGFFRPTSIDLPLSQLALLQEKNSLITRYLNVCTLQIQTTGGFVATLPAIEGASLLRQRIIELKE